jgi:hypothetical protein
MPVKSNTAIKEYNLGDEHDLVDGQVHDNNNRTQANRQLPEKTQTDENQSVLSDSNHAETRRMDDVANARM